MEEVYNIPLEDKLNTIMAFYSVCIGKNTYEFKGDLISIKYIYDELSDKSIYQIRTLLDKYLFIPGKDNNIRYEDLILINNLYLLAKIDKELLTNKRM